MTDLEAKKELLSCPGDTIQEILEDKNMSQKILAHQIGCSLSMLNELISGKAPITKEIAVKLERVLLLPANFWLNLQSQYQDAVIEIQRLEEAEKLARYNAANK